MANTTRTTSAQAGADNFCYTAANSSQAASILREKKANGTEWVYDVYENGPSHPKPAPLKSQERHASPTAEKVALVKAWQRECKIVANQGQTFLPRVPNAMVLMSRKIL